MDDYPRRASKLRNNQEEQQQIQYKDGPEIDEVPRRKTNLIKKEQPDVAARHRHGRGRRRGGRPQQLQRQDDQILISLSSGTEITIRQRDRAVQGHNILQEAGCREWDEAMCSLLTLAAEHKVLQNKSVITLRLMLHSYSSNNTNSLTERAKYYDPGMEEVKRLMLESSTSPYSKIVIELVLEDGTQWTPKKKFPLRKIKEGRQLQHHSDHHYHPEQLVDFPLEAKVDAAPLSCHLEINIHYTHPNHIQNYIINLDYPSSFTPSHRNSEVQADLLEKIFIAIARNIGPDFGQLAIRLGIKQHDRHEIERNHQTAFDRNFEMLSRWRMMCPELATVENLINVLRECGRKDLAETVHRKSSITNPTPLHTGSLPKPQDDHVSEEEKEEEDEEGEEEEKVKTQWQENESPRWKKKGETVLPRTGYTRQRRTSSSEEEQRQDEQEVNVKGKGNKEGDEEKEKRECTSMPISRRYQQVQVSGGDDSEEDGEKQGVQKGKYPFKPRSNTK